MKALKRPTGESAIPTPTKVPRLISCMANAGSRTQGLNKLTEPSTINYSTQPMLAETLLKLQDKLDNISGFVQQLHNVHLEGQKKLNILNAILDVKMPPGDQEDAMQDIVSIIADLKLNEDSKMQLLNSIQSQLPAKKQKLPKEFKRKGSQFSSSDVKPSGSQIKKETPTMQNSHEGSQTKKKTRIQNSHEDSQTKKERQIQNSHEGSQTKKEMPKMQKSHEQYVQTSFELIHVDKSCQTDLPPEPDLPNEADSENKTSSETEVAEKSDSNIKSVNVVSSCETDFVTSLNNLSNKIKDSLESNNNKMVLLSAPNPIERTENYIEELDKLETNLTNIENCTDISPLVTDDSSRKHLVSSHTQTVSFENTYMNGKVKLLAELFTELVYQSKKFRQLASVNNDFFQQTYEDMEEQTWKAVNNFKKVNKELVIRYKQEMAMRKKYHNELIQIRGNIRVFCRIRPPNSTTTDPNCCIFISPNDRDVVFVRSKNKVAKFDLDMVFSQTTCQYQVFEQAKSLITSCIDGFNVSILAYGQTGSGKTYTMEGIPSDPGINQRALYELFNEIALKDDWEYSISVSMIEIYNEQIRDLLSEEGASKIEVWNVEGDSLTSVLVRSVDEVNEVYSRGQKNRVCAATNLNTTSSRSHALLSVKLEGINQTTNTKTKGKLYLIDLAGSENVEKSGVDGQQLKEAGFINKSLSTFCDVINAILMKKNHIPYRNSKLTHLLQDSLGGNSKTLLITQVAPDDIHVTETLQTLQFAQRLRSIQCNSTVSKSKLNDSEGNSRLGDKSEISRSREKLDNEMVPGEDSNGQASSIPPKFASMFMTCPPTSSPAIPNRKRNKPRKMFPPTVRR